MSEDELVRLGRASEGVTPRPGFVDAVMAAVLEEQTGWWTGLPRVALRLVPALALAAVIALVWAYRSARDLDEALTTSVHAVEIEW
jgi:hypothetical protein